MKNHLYFKNPQEGVTTFKQKSRYGGNSEQSEEDKDFEYSYDYKKSDFKKSLRSFKSNKEKRREKKSIDVPKEIDLIWVKFFNIFDSSKFEQEYLRDFGLEIVTYSNWNTEAIFAVVNTALFEKFISDLEFFVNEDELNIFNVNIKFIKEFDFLSTKRRLDINNLNENMWWMINYINNNMGLIQWNKNLKEDIIKSIDFMGVEKSWNIRPDSWIDGVKNIIKWLNDEFTTWKNLFFDLNKSLQKISKDL